MEESPLSAMNEHGINDVRQTEMDIAEPLEL
jgi:hypothetical protein